MSSNNTSQTHPFMGRWQLIITVQSALLSDGAATTKYGYRLTDWAHTTVYKACVYESLPVYASARRAERAAKYIVARQERIDAEAQAYIDAKQH